MSKRPKRGRASGEGGLADRSGRRIPEVQGLMGKYYALAQGEDAAVAAA
jgi:glycyl-tRNA synthetase beta chain